MTADGTHGAGEAPPIIRFHHIQKSFPGVRALRDVTFEVEQGEIHAVVGENGAGKSTLMHILGGGIAPDSGEIMLKGEKIELHSEHDALELGISVVYQELRLCPNLTVAENIYLGRERDTHHHKISRKKMNFESRLLLEPFGVNISSHEKVANLSVAMQQMVEIVKAMSWGSRVVVLDEPTSSLSSREIETLFKNMRVLKGRGITLIYISHRLEEVFSVADRITVLRDGEYLGTKTVTQTTTDEIVSLIAGRALLEELAKEDRGAKPAAVTVLRGESMSSGRAYSDVTFRLHEREILGIYGLQGAGRTELLETLFGLRRLSSGTVYVGENPVTSTSPKDAMGHGLALIPEDRRRSGILGGMSLVDNINAANPHTVVGPMGVLRIGKMENIADSFIKELAIKAISSRQRVANLSGGNQQKVVIAKWLATHPKILLVDELTRGIDVGAKAEIYAILRRLRDQGLSILMVSSELQEILSICDRTLVMRLGSVVADLSDAEMTKANVLRWALGAGTSSRKGGEEQ